MRPPRSLQEQSGALAKASDELTDEFGRTPTGAELGERTGLAREVVDRALEAQQARQTSSLDAPVSQDDGSSGTLIETLAPRIAGSSRSTLS